MTCFYPIDNIWSKWTVIIIVFFVEQMSAVFFLKSSVAFSIKSSHLICSENELAGFYMKRKTGLKWINRWQYFTACCTYEDKTTDRSDFFINLLWFCAKFKSELIAIPIIICLKKIKKSQFLRSLRLRLIHS